MAVRTKPISSHGKGWNPPQEEMTCPDFQTTPEFLDVHRRQRDDTRVLIATAEADGRFRLATNHRQVHHNLEQVINALEAFGSENAHED